MRLATHVAFTTTLLSALSCSIICICGIHFFHASEWILLLIIPVSCIAFFLSLAIAHFTSKPFRELAQSLKRYHKGDYNISFKINHGIYESEELSHDIEGLIDTAESHKDEIAILRHREGEFISDVAHEFRTPLTAISGNAELMMDPDMPLSMRQHFLQITLSEAERLNNLVNDLISLRHIQEDSPTTIERVNIRQIAEEVGEILSANFQKKDIEFSIDGEAPDILIDPARLKQAIINLTDNACKHVPEGGSVKIMLSGVDDKSIIAVKDNGVGFGDINPSLLFKRFYRTDFSRSRVKGGSGLGLSIVQAIVEGNDGNITAFNDPEGGAVFLIAFPSVIDR